MYLLFVLDSNHKPLQLIFHSHAESDSTTIAAILSTRRLRSLVWIACAVSIMLYWTDERRASGRRARARLGYRQRRPEVVTRIVVENTVEANGVWVGKGRRHACKSTDYLLTG